MTEDMDNPTAHDAVEQLDEQPDREDADRYGVLGTENDNVLLYDRENPSAWIQSDVALTPAEIR